VTLCCELHSQADIKRILTAEGMERDASDVTVSSQQSLQTLSQHLYDYRGLNVNFCPACLSFLTGIATAF
jgi:hypothetical protein